MSIPLVPILRSSLAAKVDRILRSPLVASIVDDEEGGDSWHRHEDDTWSLDVAIDYEDRWRDDSREVVDRLRGAVQTEIALLTQDQYDLLVRAPREFLALSLPAESALLVDFERQRMGGMERVVRLRLASVPEQRGGLVFAAIVPNLVQLERQIAALDTLERASGDDGLAPLRALVGQIESVPLDELHLERVVVHGFDSDGARGFDPSQRECIRLAASSPHFTVIHGPPGSGKTKVITAILRDTVARGGKALVVSPTHVAIDNLVERLVVERNSDGTDSLTPLSLPVRYAGAEHHVSDRALPYVVSRRGERRAATLAERIERSLRERLPFASRVFDEVDERVPGHAPISGAVAKHPSVFCGTTIGVLACNAVKEAPPADFDVLVVDESSKMTLSEFLAVAVKAKRWVLVGDPIQLPVHNDAEANAETLDDVVDSELELVSSVATYLTSLRSGERSTRHLIVAASRPREIAHAIREHLRAIRMDVGVTVACLEDSARASVVVCRPNAIDAACAMIRDGTRRDPRSGACGASLELLVELGVDVPKSGLPMRPREVNPRKRFGAVVFERAFQIFHAEPWSRESGYPSAAVARRHEMHRMLPSVESLVALGYGEEWGASAAERRGRIVSAIAGRFLVNAASVLDWLSPDAFVGFDVPPLVEASAYRRDSVVEAVHPYVGRLQHQYRMKPGLSRVPRDFFYGGRALLDACEGMCGDGCVELVQVDCDPDVVEANLGEVDTVCELLATLGRQVRASGAAKKSVFIVTPYREQERALREAIRDRWGDRGPVDLEAHVLTLDRCQGREADFVIISLVRRRASPFLDAPKRWNVAVTRAKEHMTIVGDIESYRAEAREYRRGDRAGVRRASARARSSRRELSVIAGLIEAYDAQRMEGGRP